MAESERSIQAAGSPEEQPVFPGQEDEEQPLFPAQEDEAPHASPQDVVGPSGAAVAYEGDGTATPGWVSDDLTSVGDAGLIGG